MEERSEEQSHLELRVLLRAREMDDAANVGLTLERVVMNGLGGCDVPVRSGDRTIGGKLRPRHRRTLGNEFER